MKALYLSSSLVLCAVLFGAASACVVDFPDELPYGCETDTDCGGDGYVCTVLPDSRRYCCLPSPETCNKIDDDCDGKVDEDFDFRSGHDTCGSCDHACTALEDCVEGQCARKHETVCGNNQDDDEDGAVDCADTDCANLACGEGCMCTGGKKVEKDCTNQKDDDGDSLVDCQDPDCDTQACSSSGTGAVCYRQHCKETDCSDTIDNDGDNTPDCEDPDCEGVIYSSGLVCTVANGPQEVVCIGGQDEDHDGLTDCRSGTAEPNCLNGVCGVGCQYNNTATGVCIPSNKLEVFCDDAADNDGDGKTDCEDADCDGKSCNYQGGCTCVTLAKKETTCNDNVDNDGDGKTDCADEDCVGQTCNATGGTCSNTTPSVCQ